MARRCVRTPALESPRRFEPLSMRPRPLNMNPQDPRDFVRLTMKTMNNTSWLRTVSTRFERRDLSGKRQSNRQHAPRFIPRFIELEDRCVPATDPYIVLLPTSGTVQDIGAVMYAPAT